jgi:hypothetical protein
MKLRKDLALSSASVTGGRQIASQARKSISAVIEAQLPVNSSAGDLSSDYWRGPALKPLSRLGDSRTAYLKRKHGS